MRYLTLHLSKKKIVIEVWAELDLLVHPFVTDWAPEDALLRQNVGEDLAVLVDEVVPWVRFTRTTRIVYDWTALRRNDLLLHLFLHQDLEFLYLGLNFGWLRFWRFEIKFAFDPRQTLCLGPACSYIRRVLITVWYIFFLYIIIIWPVYELWFMLLSILFRWTIVNIFLNLNFLWKKTIYKFILRHDVSSTFINIFFYNVKMFRGA